MGFFDSLRKNMPGGPKSVAQHLLKYYLSDVAKYPHLHQKDIFGKMLHDRYAVLKTMNESDINNIAAEVDTLIELTLRVIAHENPASMSAHYQEETLLDIFKYFQENAPLEFDKYVKKAQAAENVASSNDNRNIPPSRYDLESALATMVDTWPPDIFYERNPYAFIVMYNDYSFSYQVVREHEKFMNKERVSSYVNLKEIEPEFTLLSRVKKEGSSSGDPVSYMRVDKFATKAVELLLKGSIEL
jgi:hypothetical protein